MTSVAVLTPTGRGAVAVVRVRGPLGFLDDSPALFAAVSGQGVTELPVGRVSFGRWNGGGGPAEEVIAYRTAEDEFEICCHGGPAAVRRIIADLASRGCEVVDSARAARDESCLLDSECLEAVTRATTVRTADFLLQQQSGLLRCAFEQLANTTMRQVGNAKRQVDELLRWAGFGLHLTQPWRVVLCGRPNVGKSSLLNALVGYSRAIVFDQPGTTRDVVTAETALEGWPIEFSDTAGLRDSTDEIELAGVERARRRIATADLLVILLDASVAPHADDRRLVEAWPDAVIVAHKCDLPAPAPAPVHRGDQLPTAALPVSSLTGEGVARLAAEIVRRLVPAVPPPMTPLPVAPRHVAVLREIRELIDTQAGDSALQHLIAALISGS